MTTLREQQNAFMGGYADDPEPAPGPDGLPPLEVPRVPNGPVLPA